VRTAWDVITTPVSAASAVVFDDTGTFEAISAADALIAAGTPGEAITIVGRCEQLGANIPYPPATVEASSERLFGAGVRFVPHLALREIRATEVMVRGVGHERTFSVPAEVVILCTYHEPERGLADALTADGRRAHVVGDAAGTSTIQAAVRSATDIARNL
jgi:hypothetical protein